MQPPLRKAMQADARGGCLNPCCLHCRCIAHRRPREIYSEFCNKTIPSLPLVRLAVCWVYSLYKGAITYPKANVLPLEGRLAYPKTSSGVLNAMPMFCANSLQRPVVQAAVRLFCQQHVPTPYQHNHQFYPTVTALHPPRLARQQKTLGTAGQPSPVLAPTACACP